MKGSRVVAFGVALWLGCAGYVACGSLPSVVQCQLDAVAVLPLDEPDAITVGDARALARRLEQCRPQQSAVGDAGQ